MLVGLASIISLQGFETSRQLLFGEHGATGRIGSWQGELMNRPCWRKRA